MYNSAYNFTKLKNVYPTAAGGSLGQVGGISQVGGGSNPTKNADATSVQTPMVGTAAVSSGGTSALYWVAIVALLIGLMWFSQRWGSEGKQFSDLRLSIYNIFVITLAAIVGLASMKALFTKFPVRGLSQVVLAA